MRTIAQEHPMGCAVACVASLLRMSYKRALHLFDHPEHAGIRGYYCPEICKALAKHGLHYHWKKFTKQDDHYLTKIGTIFYVKEGSDDPYGHFLLCTKKGYMNPWINFPLINPAKAGFNKKLPGKAKYVLFPI